MWIRSEGRNQGADCEAHWFRPSIQEGRGGSHKDWIEQQDHKDYCTGNPEYPLGTDMGPEKLHC